MIQAKEVWVQIKSTLNVYFNAHYYHEVISIEGANVD